MIERLSLRLRVLLFFVALALGSIAALGGGVFLALRRFDPATPQSSFVLAGLVAGFVILGLIVWVWFLFDEHVARAIERLAGGIRARAHAAVDGDLDAEPGRYLGDLAPAAAAVTATLAETRNALAEAVARETTRLAEEKARLAILLSDVPVGVLLCSGEHQMVFYNSQAIEYLGAGATPGLDRPVFEFLREAPLRHAYARLRETNDVDAVSDLLCATVTGAQVLAVRMRLLDTGDNPGYVLTLRDVTTDLAAQAARDALMGEIFDRVRRPAANLQSIVGVMEDEPGDALGAALRQEVAKLREAITELGSRHDASRGDRTALGLVRASDLADSMRARIEAGGGEARVTSDALLLRCDGFGIIALISDLALRLLGEGVAKCFSITIAEDGTGAMIDLRWQGAALGVGQLDRWLAEPLEVGIAGVTGASVLTSHATECWPEAGVAPGEGAGQNSLRLPIHEASRAHRRPAPIPRAVVYDFDLLSRARSAHVAETRLEDLTCVVFDTETTGLSPVGGDEIVQIAAVRLVNGRRVEGEIFNTLVNPGRTIPPGSTEVHGITDAMVADAPDISEVGARFHRFAEGAVLIAHNAPFDMAFLRRHERTIGARFDNPVLDTVLLSAVVFGQGETHSLDELAHRLGITIPEEARHTALGDTLATADAFLRMVPMLRAKGLETFGEVLAEVRKHGRLLKDLNG